MEDGAEQPISYASRNLTSAEKKYSQLDKEALAIVYAGTKFHQYLYGRDFTLFTDHKPHTYLFSSDRAVPQMASSRLQRWALTLSSYRYSVVFRRARDNSNADTLSQLPLPDSPLSVPVPGDILATMEHLTKTPVNAEQIKVWTSKDPVLSEVCRYIQNGWPVSATEDDLVPFKRRMNELTVPRWLYFLGISNSNSPTGS